MNLYFTQMDPVAPKHVTGLEAKGWQVLHMPFRKVAFERVTLPELMQYELCIISSKQAARWFLNQGFQKSPPLAVVGKTSSALLKDYPLFCEADVPANAQELVKMVRERCHKDKILYLCGANARETIPLGLQDYAFTSLIVYRTESVKKKSPKYSSGMVYFQAPSTVMDFLETYGERPELIGAIGPSTEQALNGVGWQVDFRPSRPETTYMVNEIPKADEIRGL